MKEQKVQKWRNEQPDKSMATRGKKIMKKGRIEEENKNRKMSK